MVGRNRLTMYSNTRCTAPNSIQYAPNVLKQVPPQVVSATSTAPSGVVDPYARPMAIKDLADTLPRSVVVKATVVQGNHGYDRQALSQGVLQMNSFMRPRSASLVPLEAVMGRKEGTIPRQVGYQNEVVRPGGQVTHVTQVNGVRSGPSQFRYSTRSLSTQWLNSLAQAGMVQSGSAQSGINGAKRCVVPNSPGQVMARNSSGQVIQVKYGTSNGYLLNGTPVGVNGVPNSSIRESNFSAYRTTGANRSLSTGADHSFVGPEQIPGVASRCEFNEPYPSDTASLCNLHNNRMAKFDDEASFRNQMDRTNTVQQGVPTRGTNSLSAMVTQTGATTSLHTFADSVPGNIRNGPPDSNSMAQVRKQVKVDMSMVAALVDKMRNISVETANYEDAVSGNTRNHFEPRVQLKKHDLSLVDVTKDSQKTLENSGSRTKGTAAITNTTNTSKPQSGVVNKPPSGAMEKPVVGLGPRNQLISQEKLKRMPVTNTLTGSPFPTKPLTIQDLSHIANPRPLPPAPQKQSTSGTSVDKAARPSTQKLENGSRSSSYVDMVEEESLLGKQVPVNFVT